MSALYKDQGKWKERQNYIYSNFNNKEFITHFKLIFNQFRRNSIVSSNKNVTVLDRDINTEDYRINKKKHVDSNSTNKKGEKGKKKLIIHLVPSKESNFYNSMIEKKEKVISECGTDDTHKYDTHISVTGYFFCSDVNLFLATLYMYFYYYIKFLNYSYVNLSLNRKLNNAFRENNFYTLYNRHRSKKPNQIIQQMLINVKKKWKLKNILISEKKKEIMYSTDNQPSVKKNEETEIDNERNTYLLATEDGYVIIPILCEWMQKFFENFYCVIKGNNFTYYTKNKTKMNLLKNKQYSNVDSTLCDSVRTQHVISDINDRSQEENLVHLDSLKKQNETIKHEEEEKQKEDIIKRSHMEKGSNVDSSKVSVCSTNLDDIQSEYKNKKEQTKNFVNQYKRMKILKKKHTDTSTQKPNEIKYKFNNTRVKITDFRIKQWNHISLASNRHNQNVLHAITNIYKDINIHNCSWDLVIYKYDEKTNIQEKCKNNFLNEVFRLKHFAIS